MNEEREGGKKQLSTNGMGNYAYLRNLSNTTADTRLIILPYQSS